MKLNVLSKIHKRQLNRREKHSNEISHSYLNATKFHYRNKFAAMNWQSFLSTLATQDEEDTDMSSRVLWTNVSRLHHKGLTQNVISGAYARIHFSRCLFSKYIWKFRATKKLKYVICMWTGISQWTNVNRNVLSVFECHVIRWCCLFCFCSHHSAKKSK